MSALLRASISSLGFFLGLFPYRWVSRGGALVGEAVYRVTGFRGTVIGENLEKALGLEGPAREEMVRKNFRHYGQAVVDFILACTWSKKTYLEKVQLHGRENLEQALQQGRGVYILSCHLGSWELAIGSLAASGIPLDVVVKRAQSDSVEDFFQWYRKRTGAGIFLETKTHQQILGSLRKNRCVGFILDQFMGPPIGLPVDFFGKPAGTAAALALLLERHPAPVIVGHAYRDDQGYPHTSFSSPLALPTGENRVKRLYARTQAFNDAIEKLVRRHPDQWLWLHRRWKPYRGQPRWKLAAVQALLVFVLAACGTFGESKTGIELPPDPKVNVPKFETADKDEPKSIEEQRTETEHAQSMGIVKATPKEKAKKKKIVKKAVKKKKINPYRVIPVDRIPFRVGEKMVLDLTWVALPAGKATLEVRPGPQFHGRDTFHLWGNVTSSRLVDAIYHVDNTVETFVDRLGLIPYRFLLHMVESKQLKETRVVFDHPKREAHYWSKRISERWGNEVVDKVDKITPAAKDMWGALYYARTLNFSKGKTYTFPVFEKGKNFDISLTALENEIVRTPVGIFQAWKLGVKIRLAQHLKQTGDIFLWISDDSSRFIVKFEGKIKIGSLKGTLVELKER